jgi:cell division protein FtsB
MAWLRKFWKKLAAIVAIIVVFFLLMDLFGRLSALSYLRRQSSRAEERVVQLTATLQALSTQLAYATSDAAVDEWARVNGHMIQPGDQPVVLIPGNGATPMPEVTVQPFDDLTSHWRVWLALFFGDN